MPRGLSKIKEMNAESAARRAAYEEGGPGVRFLSLGPKSVMRANVRFLEQGEDVFFLYIHQLPRKPGQQFGDKTPCLDQDNTGAGCPGCERGEYRSYVVLINCIWFDAPKLVRDAKGKAQKDGNGRWMTDGTETCVAVWERGPTEGDRLTHLDAQYNGLTNWIWTITREGTGKDDTKYHIDPANPTGGPTVPSPAEVELASKKYDLANVKRAMSYADMARAYSGGGAPGLPAGAPATPPQTAPAQPNAFEAARTGGAINQGAFQ